MALLKSPLLLLSILYERKQMTKQKLLRVHLVFAFLPMAGGAETPTSTGTTLLHNELRLLGKLDCCVFSHGAHIHSHGYGLLVFIH